MTHVFLVFHEYTLPVNRDQVKLIGAYSSQINAQRAVERVRSAPGFRDTPEGFAITEYEVDKDHWIEGYVEV